MSDIARDAAELFRSSRHPRMQWDHGSGAEEFLIQTIQAAITCATAADKDRIAELEGCLGVVKSAFSLGEDELPDQVAIEAQSLATDLQILKLGIEVKEEGIQALSGCIDQLRAQLVAKTQECEGLRGALAKVAEHLTVAEKAIDSARKEGE